MMIRESMKNKAIWMAIIGCLTVGLYIFIQKVNLRTRLSVKPQPTVRPTQQQVYDCITKEPRGAGQPGLVKTVEVMNSTVWEGAALPEERSKSQEEFVKIYKTRGWGGDHSNPLDASGPGSTLLFTIEAMAGLQSVITDIKTQLGKDRISMLDIPCGDMRWMPRFLETREDVDYTGMDIVPELIAIHQHNYSSKPWTFIHRDIIKDGLNGVQYDLVFSRQMLQHLVNRDVIDFLHKISQSGSRYLLVTSFPMTERNVELNPAETYRFHYLNLEVPPISLASPLCYYRDGPNPQQLHALMLYKLPLQQVVDCREAKAMKIKTSRTKLDTYYACGNWSI